MAYGQPFMAVWAAPYHETLFAFAGLVQRRRVEALEDHARDLKAAFRINAAFAAPKELEKEHAGLMRDLRRLPEAKVSPLSADEIVQKFANLQPVTSHGD